MSEDYWATHTIVEHEQALKAINKRVISGEKIDVQAYLDGLFGLTPEEKQEEMLEAQINEKISDKMKATLSLEAYFNLREKIRRKILDAPQEEAKKIAEEEARITGNTCIVCGADNCKSKGREWVCINGHRFRKH